MNDISKQQLRAEMRHRFRLSDTEKRKDASRQWCERLHAEPLTAQAKYIMAFSPLPDEVDIMPLLLQWHKEEKVILLPEVISDTEMRLRLFNGISNMTSGRFDISIPQGDIFTAYEKIEAVLVPGMAFTSDGKRLGRGKGYYDRFLPLLPKAMTRAIYYPYQIVDFIPTDRNDITIDYV